jgi:LacI family transcriptional regulator
MGTIHEVAKLAGVSPTTVSMVLNNKHGTSIPPPTCERVLAAADELGYRPNPYARALVGSKAPLIKLVYRPHEMYIGNLKGASLLAKLRAMDREIMVTDSLVEDDPEAFVEGLLWGMPEAVMFQYVSHGDTLAEVCTALHAQHVHCIIADCWELPDPQVPCDAVTVDRLAGIALGVGHLVERGHRDVGLVLAVGQFGRLQGYDETLHRHGISDRYVARFDPQNGPSGRTRETTVAMAAKNVTTNLLQGSPQVTALMCGSDMAALGAMRAAAELGYTIPEDLALVGFHGEPWTELLPVPLTTVAEPVAEMCELATEILRARLDSDTQPWLRTRVTPHLLVRQSTE